MEHLEELKTDLSKDSKELTERHSQLTKSKQSIEHELKKIETELLRINGALMALEELKRRNESKNEGKLDSSEENKD